MDGVFALFIGCAWIAIGALVGYNLGKAKGKGEIGAILGALFWIIGWIIVLLLPDDSGMKCPDCFGRVPIGARKCKHCGSDIRDALTRADAARMAARGNYRAKPVQSMQDAAWTKCPCRKCGGLIEFDIQQFDRNNPDTIDCPHCEQPTTLYVNR